MFLLPRRQIWTQQPQALTGIDRSDSITRDLCFVQSGGLADIFTNVGATQKPTTRGVVRSFDAALSQYLVANNKQVVGPALTLFALFSVNNLTGNLALISVGGPASSRHILYAAPDGVAAMFSGEGVPYGQAQSATGTLSDTAQYYFSVGRVSANNSRDIWVNGIQVASNSTSVAVSPANIDRVAIGAYWNNGAPVAGLYFDGNIALSGAYSRALSDDEIVVLSANPWQIFKRPDSRIFVPVSAGGGGTQTLTPPLHTNSQSFYSPAVSQSSAPQSLTASLFTSSSTIFVPTVLASKVLSAGLFSNANTLYSPTVTATKTLATSFYSNAQVFYAHVLNQVGGPQNVVVPLLNNTQTFYSPLLSPGAVSVAPSLYANAPTFYGLTVTTSKTLTASLFSNASELYEPLATLAGGPLVIAPSLFSNTASFFTHTVASGLVQLYPVRFDSPSGFYAPVVSTGSFSGSISAPSGSGPTVIQPGSYRPSNTGGRRY